MNDSLTPAALHAALRYVVTSDILAEHKAVLIEALTQAIRDQETVRLRRTAEQPDAQWQAHEQTLLQTFLVGKVANSWQQADEFLTQIAAQLHRTPRDVRAKATELGVGAGVDYRLAREVRKARQE